MIKVGRVTILRKVFVTLCTKSTPCNLLYAIIIINGQA